VWRFLLRRNHATMRVGKERRVIDQRTIQCGECQRRVQDDGGLPEEERSPCPYCGSRTRLFNVSVHETIAPADSLQAQVVRLSEETSATAMAVTSTTFGAGLTDDLWKRSGPIREVLLKHEGSDQALRAIADGYLEFAPGYTGDRYDRFVIQYNAREILREREEAAERQRLEQDAQRADRKGRIRLLWDLLKILFRGST
jgi:DNA-directed RNA polymerase subunit RPC12/RpoP